MSFAEYAALVGFAVGIATLVGLAVKIGRAAGRIEEAQRQLAEYLPLLKHLPVLETRVGNVEQIAAKSVSDIRELREKQAFARGETTGRLRALSRPDPDEAG